MKILDALKNLAGKASSGREPEPGSTARAACPDEVEILNYTADAVSESTRESLEHHFAQCDDCRELLVLYAQVTSEQAGKSEPVIYPITESELEEQTAKVLALIKEDEWNRRKADIKPKPERTPVTLSGVFITYTQLAVFSLICAIAVAVVYFITRSAAPEQIAMQELASALEKERRIEPRISGDFSHSNYSQIRGEERKYEVEYDRALNKLKVAEMESASAKERMALARVYLARNENNDAERASKILRELAGKGERSPELFNDLGISLYMQGKYREAIAEFNKSLGMSPDFDHALFNRALAETEIGLTEEARRDWQHFLRVANDPQWKAEAESRLSALEKSMNR